MNKVKRFLFLDDYRSVHDVYPEEDLSNWAIVKNYDEFINTINTEGAYNLISFDHDLHHEHYRYLSGEFPYDEVTEKTGWHCLKYLLKHCRQNNLAIPICLIHTMNPIGKINMIDLLKRNGYRY